MPDRAHVVLTFQRRELSPFERELVREWQALAGDISEAHVNARRSDDPALYRRIVVSDAPDGRPTHLIHQPDGLGTLRAALNSIRHVLVDGGERQQKH